MFAYLVLLHDPKPHPLLCIEEPENQLYPTLMSELAEEFRDYFPAGRPGNGVYALSRSSQCYPPGRGLLACQEQRGFPDPRAADDRQVKRYMEQGDKMGYLWKQGFFTGANPA
jgi:hypothetical protein